jgi:hypothetical protein
LQTKGAVSRSRATARMPSSIVFLLFPLERLRTHARARRATWRSGARLPTHERSGGLLPPLRASHCENLQLSDNTLCLCGLHANSISGWSFYSFFCEPISIKNGISGISGERAKMAETIANLPGATLSIEFRNFKTVYDTRVGASGCECGASAVSPPSEAKSFLNATDLVVAVVQPFMATRAQRDQIRILIRALLTSQLFVMDLQVLARPADLTLPPVPLHYLPAELLVRVGL